MGKAPGDFVMFVIEPDWVICCYLPRGWFFVCAFLFHEREEIFNAEVPETDQAITVFAACYCLKIILPACRQAGNCQKILVLL